MTLTLKKINRFNFFLALIVIGWGAWVRLSGSGAGCGEHWPLCNGQVIPLDQSLKTFIEFTHRVSSGLYGLTVLGALIFAYKKFPQKHPAVVSSLLLLIITIIEALIGAVLVKKGLVDKNDSTMRAIVIALHLVNTYFLLGAHALVEFFSHSKNKFIKINKISFMSWSLIFLFLIVGASGAITSLGNTLFPETSLFEGMAKDFSRDAHFLTRLRIYHPIGAILLCLGLTYWSLDKNKVPSSYLLKMPLMIAVMVIFAIVNWALLAPTWGAIGHLILGDILWTLFILALLSTSLKSSTEKS